MQPVPVKTVCAVIATLLVMSLTACGTKPQTPPGASFELPLPPSLSTPIPQTSYSLSAAEAIKAWRLRLMDTQLMQPPAEQLGQ